MDPVPNAWKALGLAALALSAVAVLAAPQLVPGNAGPLGTTEEAGSGGGPGQADRSSPAVGAAGALHLPEDPVTRLDGLEAGTAFELFQPPFSGAEPSIGVTPDGETIFAQYGLSTGRSTDGGATWQQISPLPVRLATFDPILHYDDTADRLYVSHLTIECSMLAWTDAPRTVAPNSLTGDGEWLYNPHACGLPAMDRQAVETGPSPIEGIANGGRAAYMSANQVGVGATVFKSVDGGLTWVPAVAASFQVRGTPAWPVGDVKADPAGTYVYLPHHTPSNGLMVSHSHNEGHTFATKVIDGSDGASGTNLADLAVDAAGNVYVAWWNNEDQRLYLSRSYDHGLTWEPALPLTDGTTIKSTVFPAIVAGAQGKLAIAFLGTPSSEAGANACAAVGPDRCIWYAYVAHVEGADTAAPTVTFTRINPTNDPVQIGRICTLGVGTSGGCASGTRNLLDFIDIDADDDGRVHVVYADGCVGACDETGQAQSTAAQARYARQTAGPSIG